MRWFNKNKSPRPELPTIISDKRAIIEIEAHKDAEKEAVLEAKQASQKLNDLLVEDGFTLKIYLATGGHVTKKRKT